MSIPVPYSSPSTSSAISAVTSHKQRQATLPLFSISPTITHPGILHPGYPGILHPGCCTSHAFDHYQIISLDNRYCHHYQHSLLCKTTQQCNIKYSKIYTQVKSLKNGHLYEHLLELCGVVCDQTDRVINLVVQTISPLTWSINHHASYHHLTTNTMKQQQTEFWEYFRTSSLIITSFGFNFGPVWYHPTIFSRADQKFHTTVTFFVAWIHFTFSVTDYWFIKFLSQRNSTPPAKDAEM